jgi:hypothetical protein
MKTCNNINILLNSNKTILALLISAIILLSIYILLKVHKIRSERRERHHEEFLRMQNADDSGNSSNERLNESSS